MRQTSAHYRGRGTANVANDDTAVGTLRTLTDALNNALDEGARVINISVVSCIDPRIAPRVETADLDSALARAESDGAVVVAAAGNLSTSCPQNSLVLPSHSPTVLAVGSRSDSYTVADYSLPVPEDTAPLSALDEVAAAPSPDGRGWARGTVNQSGEVSPFIGTSFAAPVLTGSVALLLQRYPELSPAEVRTLVTAAAQPNGGAIDPQLILTQLTPDKIDEAAPLHITATQKELSTVNQRWRVFMMCLVAGLAVTVGAIALARPSTSSGKR